MLRVLTSPKTWAAATAVALALAPAAPAMAANTAIGHRAGAVPPTMVLDFNGTNDEASTGSTVGTGFGGSATVKDSNGNKIATAYDQCDKDSVTPASVTVFCAGQIVFNGSSDQIAFQVVAPIQDPKTAKYPLEFNGVVTGGTGQYEGLTGEIHFTNTSLATYVISFG
ncbi:hypothetical protein [Kitasatospora sp. LaBMicrA B282]|uniref:hypothetical protein n=1 Tax=Kitasatospora sp. LaBMicrA B282 TaxID=3420949 RepID=UPI003D0EA928